MLFDRPADLVATHEDPFQKHPEIGGKDLLDVAVAQFAEDPPEQAIGVGFLRTLNGPQGRSGLLQAKANGTWKARVQQQEFDNALGLDPANVKALVGSRKPSNCSQHARPL